MNKSIKIIFSLAIIIGFLAMGGECWATDYYFAQSAIGNENGIDCDNAYAVGWVNSSSNWANPKQFGKIGPGDTVHLCGMITVAAGGTGLTIGASGTDSNPITIKFEDGATLESPSFYGVAGNYIGGGIYTNSKSYLVIDGGTNGIIRATDNGTGKTYAAKSVGVQITGGNNIEVKNLKILDIYTPSTITGTCSDAQTGGAYCYDPNIPTNGTHTYMRYINNTTGKTAAGLGSTYNPGDDYFYFPLTGGTWSQGDSYTALEIGAQCGAGVVVYNTDYTTIHNVYVENVGKGISWISTNDTNLEVYNSTFKYVGVGAWPGSNDTSHYLTNFWFHDNIVSDMNVFGYSDGLKFTAGNAGYRSSGIKIYNNVIGPNVAYSSGNCSAYIILDHGDYDNPQIYNNLFLGAANANDRPSVLLQIGGPVGTTPIEMNSEIYNNTFVLGYTGGNVVGITFPSAYASSGHKIKNNIISLPNLASPSYLVAINYSANSSIAEADHNNYNVPLGTLNFGDGSTRSFPQWKIDHPTFDASSITTDPLLDEDYGLTSSSPTKDAGLDLSSCFTTDKNGISRPQGSAWDIGAYEYVESGGDAVPPSVPSNLTVR